ncbi:phage tail protein [Enterobacter cancerogenus]|uniref:phage tail protein n=1 Tax=Enterobacter cancerogenus TaxID=69218 RepID=UPI000FDA04E7
MEGSFSLKTRSATFGDGYEQIAGEGIILKSSLAVTPRGKSGHASGLKFFRSHVTKSSWNLQLAKQGCIVSSRINQVTPLSSKVITISEHSNRRTHHDHSRLSKLEPGNKVRLIEVDGSTFGVMMYCDFTRTTSRTRKRKSPPLVVMNQAEGEKHWCRGRYAAWPYQLKG